MNIERFALNGTSQVTGSDTNRAEPDRFVVNTNDQLRVIYRHAVSILLAANDPPILFRRGGELVTTEQYRTGRVIVPVTKARLQKMLCEQADWYHVTEQGERVSAPPASVTAAILDQPDERFPPLDALAQGPMLGPDWDLITEPGYHQSARIILDTDMSNNRSELFQPSLEDARSLIFEALQDFPFADTASRAHAIALMLLPFVRPALGLNTTPLHFVHSPTPGTGKGKLVDLVSVIAMGRRSHPTTLSSSSDENRKKLTALLAQGERIILLDNVPQNRILNDPALASILTTSVPTDRLLGRSKMLRLSNQAVWMVTANNPQFTLELARRSVSIHLDAQCERPWLRSTFRHPDLIGWASENRRSLVAACLTLIKAWLDRGQPKACGQLLGSFEVWSSIIGGILNVARIPGFLENLNEAYSKSDTLTEEWRALAEVWWKKYGSQPVNASAVCELCHEHVLLDEVIGFGSSRSQLSRLGRALQRNLGCVYDDKKLIRHRDAVRSSARYRLVTLLNSRSPGLRPN